MFENLPVKMDEVDRKAYLEDIKFKISIIKKAIQNLQKASEIEKEIDRITEQIGKGEADNMDTRVYERTLLTAFLSLSRSIQRCIRSLHTGLTSPSYTYQFTPLICEAFIPEYQPHEPDQDVLVRISEEAVFVKMPVLCTSNYLERTLTQERRKDIYRDDIYVKPIVEQLTKSKEYYELDIRKFKYKTVHFLYIYPVNFSRKVEPADVTNHQTKLVQDAVTGYLAGGDSAFNCSVFMSAECSDLIPSGTYMTVSAGKNNILSSKEIICFWSEELSKHS